MAYRPLRLISLRLQFLPNNSSPPVSSQSFSFFSFRSIRIRIPIPFPPRHFAVSCMPSKEKTNAPCSQSLFLPPYLSLALRGAQANLIHSPNTNVNAYVVQSTPSSPHQGRNASARLSETALETGRQTRSNNSSLLSPLLLYLTCSTHAPIYPTRPIAHLINHRLTHPETTSQR